jgi:hypothetical protein
MSDRESERAREREHEREGESEGANAKARERERTGKSAFVRACTREIDLGHMMRLSRAHLSQIAVVPEQERSTRALGGRGA